MIVSLLEQMDTIEYGWMGTDNKKHYNNTSYSELYFLQSPQEIEINKIGVCWDQVEYERYFFEKNNIECTTYFLCYYNNKDCPTHTFLLFEMDKKTYWFEHSWEKYRGIHKCNNKKEAIIDIKNKFIKNLSEEIEPENLCLYQYEKPEYGLDCLSFYKHAESGLNIR